VIRHCDTDGCRNFAQWRASKVIPQSKEEREADEKKKLVPRGPTILTLGFYCGPCKTNLEPENKDLAFNFVGAVKLGA
jgi:hypothetical protein